MRSPAAPGSPRTRSSSSSLSFVSSVLSCYVACVPTHNLNAFATPAVPATIGPGQQHTARCVRLASAAFLLAAAGLLVLWHVLLLALCADLFCSPAHVQTCFVVLLMCRPVSQSCSCADLTCNPVHVLTCFAILLVCRPVLQSCSCADMLQSCLCAGLFCSPACVQTVLRFCSCADVC